MALIRCPECQREISTRAPACPHCGNPQEPRSSPSSNGETSFTAESPELDPSTAGAPADDDVPDLDVALPSPSLPSLLPEPRSYFGTAIMIGALTALPFGLLWSIIFALAMDIPFGRILPLGLGGGLAFGLLFGLTMAFSLKGETTTIKFSDAKRFIWQLNIAMSELGYNPATHSADFFTYKPSFQAGLLSGRLSVQLQKGRAVVVGPKMYVKKLVKRLAEEGFF